MSDAIYEDVALEQQEGETAAESVETTEQPEESPKELSERDRALAEIAKKRYEMDGISVDQPDDEDEPEDETEPEAAELEKESEAGPEEAPADPLAELGYYRNDAGELVTKMKINGVEREVKAEQVKAYLQKDLAGDWKLQQAAERERQLQELAASLQKQREHQIRQSLSQPQPPLGAEEAKQQARTVLEKIWDGDSDGAEEALIALLQRNNATVDTNQILQQAKDAAISTLEQREIQRQQQEWEQSVDSGNAMLKQKHPEIYADQYLFDLVNGETARMVQAQQAGVPEYATLMPQQMIEKAADTVQGWLNERRSPQPSGTRGDRKKTLKPIPQGMNTPRQRKPEQELDMSPAAVIERMAAARRVN